MSVNAANIRVSTAVSDNRKTLGVVFLTVFMDLIGFGIIIPIQPFYAELLGASPALVTLLGASFSLTQFLFAPFWGRLSDRIGRRPVMLTSIGLTAVGYVGFGMSTSLVMLFAARMLAGFGSANIGTAQAIIADSTPPEQRAKGMGLIGAAFGLGFIFGPALGGSLVKFGITVPIFVAAGLCVMNWISAFFILPETLPASKEKAAANHAHGSFSWKALRHAARHENVSKIFMLYLVYTLAFSMMEQVMSLFIERTWLFDELTTTTHEMHAKHGAAMTMYVLLVVGVTATIVQGGLIGRLAKKFGERTLLVWGTLLVGVALFLIPVTGYLGAFGLLMAASMVLAFGSGITNPSLSSSLSRAVDRDEQGGTLGLGMSLSALGRVVGPSIAGVLFQMNKNLPFWVGAGLMAVSAGVSLTLKSKPK